MIFEVFLGFENRPDQVKSVLAKGEDLRATNSAKATTAIARGKWKDRGNWTLLEIEM